MFKVLEARRAEEGEKDGVLAFASIGLETDSFDGPGEIRSYDSANKTNYTSGVIPSPFRAKVDAEIRSKEAEGVTTFYAVSPSFGFPRGYGDKIAAEVVKLCNLRR